MPLEDNAGAGQPQRANAAYAISEDEISLRDLWEIIAKRKWLVFLSTVVCLGLAAAYVSLATTVYESKAVVQIGKVAGQPVDNGLQLASRLMNQYTPVNTEQAKKQMPKLYAVTPDKADGSILTLEAQGRSPQEAQQYLQGVIQRLLAEDQQRYQQIVGARQAQLTRLQAQYQGMRTPPSTKIGKGQADSTSALLFLEQSRRTDALTNIQAAIAKMENALAPNNTSPTVQTLSPRYDPIPIAPKRGLILVLAGLGGLMLGVFLALLQNAFRKQPA
ncbi:MAG: Wzz/FepE/Etk N-terminal domain-containing protein [Acidithiobacillus sp.]